MRRSFGLDLARSVAVIMVLIAHFIHKLDFLGFWGVELFFALSGYLIGQILWRTLGSDRLISYKNIVNFWQRRWYRTVPNYFLFFMVMILFHFFVTKDLPSWSIIAKYLFFLQGAITQVPNFYRVSWSLCIEEWFYLLFPVVFFILRIVSISSKYSFLLSVSLFFTFSFIAKMLLIPDVASIREITSTRLDSIASGVLIAVIFIQLKNTKRLARIAFFAGIIFLVFSVLYLVIRGNAEYIVTKSIVYLTLTPLAFACCLPYAGTLHFKMKNFRFIERYVENISLWSYSLYLSHIPILFCVYTLFGIFRENIFINVFSKISALAITFIISSLLYKHFERPITKYRPKEI